MLVIVNEIAISLNAFVKSSISDFRWSHNLDSAVAVLKGATSSEVRRGWDSRLDKICIDCFLFAYCLIGALIIGREYISNSPCGSFTLCMKIVSMFTWYASDETIRGPQYSAIFSLDSRIIRRRHPWNSLSREFLRRSDSVCKNHRIFILGYTTVIHCAYSQNALKEYDY